MVMLAFGTLANIYVSKWLSGADKCALVLVGQHVLLLYKCTNDPKSIHIQTPKTATVYVCVCALVKDLGI